MVVQFTKRKRWDKPKKPYKDFPLTPHPTGRWCKKIRGKLHYFGKLSDPQGALEKLNREWPYLSTGRTPPPIDAGGGCTIRDLCNSFLTSKRNKLAAGELSERSFRDYHQTCGRLISYFGGDRRVDDLRPDDFEGLRSKLAERLGVVSLRNEVNRCRVVFKYACDQRLIPQPVNYGQSFDRPSAKMLRKARNEAGPRLFEADELRRILEVTDPIMRAMVLLGVNGGFGNTDVASLPRSAVDLDAGWLEFPRPKTEIRRRVPLWEETVEALRSAVEQRPEPADRADDGLVFLTKYGNRWVRVKESASSASRFGSVDSLSPKFARLLKTLEVNGRRGRGFYALRHVFETVAGESRDQVAVNAIMGHADQSMAATYRERISDERLRAVVETVRAWLWPDRDCESESIG